MHIYTQTPLWKEPSGTLHVFTTCVAITSEAIKHANATDADKGNICLQCIERMKGIPAQPGIGGKLIV
jgi:hypothetical protein